MRSSKGNLASSGISMEYQGYINEPSTEECESPRECPNSWIDTAKTLARYFETERSEVVQTSSASK